MKKTIKTLILTITIILAFCFIMKNFFPAEWSFITPHKQGDFVRVGNMHHPMYGHQMILLDDGRVFVYDAGSIEVYNPKTRRFETVNEKPLKDRYATAIKLNDGRILIFGGRNKNTTTPETFIFDPKANKILTGPDMKMGRLNYAYVLLNDGRVFVSGGNNYNEARKWYKEIWKEIHLKSTEIYDPNTNKFEYGPELPGRLSGQSAIKLVDGNVILIAGGVKTSRDDIASYNYEVILYNPKTNELKTVGKLTQGRWTKQVFYVKPDKIYLMEGVGPGKYINSDDIDPTKILKSVECFDVNTGLSKIVANRTSSAEQITPILLPNDTILFAGGTSGFSIGYTEYNNAQIFDPKTNSFKWLKSKSSVPIPNGTKVLLKDGNVLITGGGRNGSKYAVIYMFNKKIKR